VDDYDAWGALGNSGWSWKNMLPYFKKVLYTPNTTPGALVVSVELTSCSNNRPRPLPHLTLRLLLPRTSRGMPRSAATLAR
jgi:choline dehydrogenase-like flavoprotein